MMSEEEKYMTRCIQLAKNGKSSVSPNPMVGAVIVCDGKIIGEGYHIRCGGAHAEVNAINSVEDKSLLSRSTIYVSLEPCSHYGKTPPCADLIISKHISRVVIGCKDPFSKVAGKGIKKLENAGIKVTSGVMEEECEDLIKPFVVFNTLHRPYITLKWAESADGYIDIIRTEGKPVLLSNSLSAMLVHKRRAESDAILVGTRTAILDNPSLTVRNWHGKNPVRMVLDKELSLSSELNLFNKAAKTFVLTYKKNVPENEEVEYITLDYHRDILSQIMNLCYEKELQSLLVEGGMILLQSFIDSNLWDEAFVEKTDKRLNNGVEAPAISKSTKHSCECVLGSEVHHFVH